MTVGTRRARACKLCCGKIKGFEKSTAPCVGFKLQAELCPNALGKSRDEHNHCTARTARSVATACAVASLERSCRSRASRDRSRSRTYPAGPRVLPLVGKLTRASRLCSLRIDQRGPDALRPRARPSVCRPCQCSSCKDGQFSVSVNSAGPIMYKKAGQNFQRMDRKFMSHTEPDQVRDAVKAALRRSNKRDKHRRRSSR